MRFGHFSARGWTASSSGIFWWRNSLTVAEGTIGRIFQRHYQSLRGMGKLPLVGPLLTWAASRAVPRDSRVWMQVKTGPAEGIWLRLNPRTAAGTINGSGWRQGLKLVRDHLGPRTTFCDV